MVTEKLAKSYIAPRRSADNPQISHSVLIKFLRLLRAMPQMQARLGYINADHYRSYIDSLLPIADQIQQLAPSAAGITQPNPEYPWRQLTDGDIIVPCEYAFELFAPESPQMAKFEKLIMNLLRMDG